MNTAINAINYGIAKLGNSGDKGKSVASCRSLSRWSPCLNVLANWFRQKSNFPHCTVCVRLFKAWRTRKDRVNLSCCRAPPSLMTDQVAALKRKGIAAVCLGADTTAEEMTDIRTGRYSMLFGATEKSFELL